MIMRSRGYHPMRSVAVLWNRVLGVVPLDSGDGSSESRESKAIWVGSAALRQRNPGLCEATRDLHVAPEPAGHADFDGGIAQG